MTRTNAEPHVDGAPGATSAPRTGLPFAALLGLVAGIAIFATSQTQLRDIDLYWHLLAGRELLDGTSPSGLGQGWSFAPDPLPWTSTQWLSEVLLSWIHDLAGWAGLAAFRVATAGIAVGILAWTTLAGRPKALAGFPFFLATAIVAFVSQERPQQFTLIGACLLGGVLVGGLVGQALPRWWLLLPATTLWANLHGGWVLVPFTLGLVTVGLWCDHGLRSAVARRSAALTGLAVVAGCLTPSGIGGLTAAVRFSRAAELISEWERVQPITYLGAASMAMLALFVVGWSASRDIPRSEGLVVLAILTFTWLAWRNLAPGMVLLAPLAAHRLTGAFPKVTRAEPRWSAPLGIALAGLLAAAGLVNVATQPTLPTATEPLTLARAISELGPGQRVLNDYNTSGIVLYFGGSGTRVAIDGRSDRYGSDYIEDYVGLMSLKGEWEALLAELDPTSALIRQDTALAYLLREVRGWVRVGEPDNGYVLLVPGSDSKG